MTALVRWATDYPAVDPTGGSDSYPGLQAILNGPDPLLVPPGVYLLMHELDIPADKTMLCMKGAKFKIGQAGIAGICLLGDRAELIGAEVDCNGLATMQGIGVYASDCTVERCYVHDSVGAVAHGIALDGQQGRTVNNNSIRNNKIYRVGSCGISQHTTTGSQIVENSLDTIGLIGLSNYHALVSYFAGNRVRLVQQEGITIDGLSSYCQLIGNRITATCLNTGSGHAGAAVSLDNSVECSVVGNFIRSCSQSGIWTANVEGAAGFSSFTGNQIVDCALYGFYFHTDPTHGYGSCNNAVSDNLVVGCPGGWARFDAGCNNNEARYNQRCGLAVLDYGIGNSY